MRFRIEQHLPGPADVVQAALVDPEYLSHLGSLPRLGSAELLERRDEGDVTRLAVRYRFVGHIPGAATRFIDPERLTWIERSVHDRRTHVAPFVIEPDHYGSLLACRGTFRLEPRGDGGVTRVAEGELSVHVPLIGGKAERAIASGMQEHADAEAPVLAAWVEERRAGSPGG